MESHLLQVECSGTPREIGQRHGEAAAAKIRGTIAFYGDYFSRTARLDWSAVQAVAQKFVPSIQAHWPQYYEEIQGISEGAGLEFLDILAINVRTEIAFGLAADGCTSLAWTDANHTIIGQNWDVSGKTNWLTFQWKVPMKHNLVLLHIRHAPPKPSIYLVTEAGIIGKIGFNSAGVGVCMNAIRALGVDYERIPSHLGFRLALECTSKHEAMQTLGRTGIASAVNMLLADGNTGAVSLEFSCKDVLVIKEDSLGRIVHANHYDLVHHPDVRTTSWLEDSYSRQSRAKQLFAKCDGEKATIESFLSILKDEDNFPTSICRKAEEGKSEGETLFAIVINLTAKSAKVLLGRPCAPENVYDLDFN